MKYTYAPTILGSIDLAEPEEVQGAEPRLPQRRMGYFYFELHPERCHVHVGGGGGDMLDQFEQAAGGYDIEALPRRGDTTIYITMASLSDHQHALACVVVPLLRYRDRCASTSSSPGLALSPNSFDPTI
jgi:hypothetical protein